MKIKIINLLQKYLPIYKYYLYNILDIILYYLIILFLLFILYYYITILIILLVPYDFLLNINDYNILYFNENSNITGNLDTHEVTDTEVNHPDTNKFYKFLNYNNIINKTKRRFFWEVVERDRNNYRTYEDFKDNWDPNTKIRSEIKNEIKSDLRQLLIAKRFISIVVKSFKPGRQK